MPNVNGILDKQQMQTNDEYRHTLRNVGGNTRIIKSQETETDQRYDRKRTQMCTKGVETNTKITQKALEDGRHNQIPKPRSQFIKQTTDISMKKKRNSLSQKHKDPCRNRGWSLVVDGILN